MQAITTDMESNSTSTLSVTQISAETKNILSSQYKRVTF